MRLVAAILMAVLAQTQPTFRSGVELIRVDVTVVDADGRPATDLRPEDFTVTVDGAPRPVAFARFYGPRDTGSPAAISTPTPTFATNRGIAPGRVVLFVVDLESMNDGYQRVLLETAGGLIDNLAPGDAVGLLPLPGKSIEVTRDHVRVREALVGLRGAAPKTFQQHVIRMQEAIAFDKLDRRVIQEVIERECRRYEAECPMDLRNEARQLLLEAHRRIQNVVTTVATLSGRLQPIQSPKDIVVLSAGLPFDQETIDYFRDLQRRVAESGTAIHVVQLAQPETDASSQRGAGAGSLPASDLRQGLSMMAGIAGGDFFEAVGRAKGVFERIQGELTHSWQLGVEAAPQDNDGKTHKISVTVKRPGLTARARRESIANTGVRASLKAADLLAQPTDAVELPVSVATYSVRGDEAATLKQIVLIHAAPIATEAPPTYDLFILKDDRIVFQTNETLEVTGTDAQAVTAAQLAPGRYRLRLAVLDSGGRGGSLEMPLSVGLRAGAPLQFSDLLVGTIGDRFTPRVEAPVGGPLGALIELYAADPAAFGNASVAFELRRSGSDVVVARSAGRVTTTALPGRRIADGSLAVTDLEPDDYTVSAVISVSGASVGRVNRLIRLKR
jgi:VWFA-related protein